MSIPPGRDVDLATAQTQLERLDRWIGAAGLAAAARIPGLLARVDQDASEVRDLFGGRPLLAELACYADGLQDGAADLGWRLPRHRAVDWTAADGVTVRLLAVCALARQAQRDGAGPACGSP